MEKRGSTEPVDEKASDSAIPSKKRLWGEAEARAVWEEWRKSGMPLETFAKKQGLVAQRLRWWCNKLGLGTRHEEGVEPVRFTPVRVVERRKREARHKPVQMEEARRGEHLQARMEVLLPDGVRIQVGQDFDAAALRRLLEVVEVRPC